MDNENNDLLVIKVNMFLRQKEMDDLYRYIRDAKKEGIIILPIYCDAIVYPKDVEIKVEDITGKEINDG